MSDQNSGFEEVGGGFTTIWNPCFTGSKKDGNLVNLEPNDKSYLIGHYKGDKSISIPGKPDKVVHQFHFVSCGNDVHLSGEMVNNTVNVWGNAVLSGKINECITSGEFVVGSLLKLQWLGLQEPKKAGGNPYHNWSLLCNKSVEPMDFSGGAQSVLEPKSKQESATPEMKPVNVNSTVPSSNDAYSLIEEEDDDLPF